MYNSLKPYVPQTKTLQFMHIDFNRLKTLTTVAQLGSITKAAAKLNLTQQAVSSQIMMLEQDLGLMLFKRANRKIYLTKEGKSIFENVDQHFTQIENHVLSTVDSNFSLNTTLSIGAANEVADGLLSDVIIKFKKHYPDIKIELSLDDDKQSEHDVLEGKLDLAFVVFSKETKLLNIQPFRKEAFITLASKKFIKKHKLNIQSFEQLLSLPIIDFQFDCPSLKTWVKKNDKKLLPHFENITASIAANDDRLIKKLILSDMGIANVPRSLFQDELNKETVIEILPKSKKIEAGLDIISMKRKTPSLVATKFIEFISQQG